MKIQEILEYNNSNINSQIIFESENLERAIKILKGIGIAGKIGIKGLWWALNNPGKAIGLVAAITHPKETYNAANFTWNLITDPANVVKILSRYAYNQSVPWGNKDQAVADLNSILGNTVTSDFIFRLAELAVNYSIPIAGIIALLYGGKKFADYLNTGEVDFGREAFAKMSKELSDSPIKISGGDSKSEIKNAQQ